MQWSTCHIHGVVGGRQVLSQLTEICDIATDLVKAAKKNRVLVSSCLLCCILDQLYHIADKQIVTD